MSQEVRLITLISNLLKITSRAISKWLEYEIVNSNIMTKAWFAYFKNSSPDEIVRINLFYYSTQITLMLLVHSVSREYIYKVIRLMNFPERLFNMIRNIYANAICQPLMNRSQMQKFGVISGVP